MSSNEIRFRRISLTNSPGRGIQVWRAGTRPLGLGEPSSRSASRLSSVASTSGTYMNVQYPSAVTSKQGRIVAYPFIGGSTTTTAKTASSQLAAHLPPSSDSLRNRHGGSPRLPVIPKSQDVKKFIKEPSYSTLLQLERLRNLPLDQQSISYISSNYGNASNYSDLDFNVSKGSVQDVDGNSSTHYAYASPPSPVSSSYSELRQATKYPLGYHVQRHQQMQQRQQQGNYDSLYEPVQISGVASNNPALFRALNSSVTSSESSDYFGLCSKCNGKIIGEGSGCHAMGRLYHIQCFTCHRCHNLLQGKPFYALDGQPYCQDDYMDTLEKCCKCLRPILDRILRATGKPYHPHCFTCYVCSQTLDGIPFTVDATNQIHCIPCFHERFAPKCSVCKLPIMPESGQDETVRVVALDRSFHVNCYRCEDCNLRLSSEEQGGSGCYPLDDHVLCKNCNTKRIQDLTNGIHR